MNSRQQLLTILAVAALAIFAGDRILFTPLTRAFKNRSEQVATLRKQVTNGRALVQRQRSIEAHWENYRTNTLPVNQSAAENIVLKAFDKWIQASRISVTNIRPEWRRNDDAYMTLQCHADAFGTMETVVKFIHLIEKDPLALRIESIELGSRDAAGQQITLGLQLSGLQLNPVDQ